MRTAQEIVKLVENRWEMKEKVLTIIFNYDLDQIRSITRFNSSFVLVVPTKSGLIFEYKFVLKIIFRNYSFCTRDIFGRSVVVAVLSDDQVVVLTQGPGCIKNSNL